jgi:hypothetical protein
MAPAPEVRVQPLDEDGDTDEAPQDVAVVLESSSGEGEREPPDSPLTSPLGEEADVEPLDREVDLLSSTIRQGSLFDQPTERGTRSPLVHADETEQVDDDARDKARRETLATLSHGRSVAERHHRHD